MNDQISNNDIVITGMSMVSSLGYDVISSCAAYRAGLSRVRELSKYTVFNDKEKEFQNLLVHQIPIITSGFEGFARLLSIGWRTLEDLLTHNDIRKWDKKNTGLYIALPNFDRVQQDISENLNEPKQEDIENSKEKSQALGHKLCNRLTELTSCLVPEQNWYIVDAGHAGMVVAIEKAMSDMASGNLDRCIVGGIDSLLDIKTLEWFHRNQRLKTEENPMGLQPGEAGAFFLFEKYEAARSRKADILSIIAATAVDSEPEHIFTGKPSLGKGLGRTILHLFSKMGDKETKPEWIITDQNGEPYRACEWGGALVQLSAAYPDLRDASLWYPAMSFGDTGAASGAIAICSAVRAFIRNYAVSKDVIILSSSDRGERAALYLTEFRDR